MTKSKYHLKDYPLVSESKSHNHTLGDRKYESFDQQDTRDSVRMGTINSWGQRPTRNSASVHNWITKPQGYPTFFLKDSLPKREAVNWIRDKFIYLDEFKVTIPVELKYLRTSIDEARYILKLEENWDDEGSKGYKTETWRQALSFLIQYSKWIFNKTGKVIKPPEIIHANNGAIELVWRTPQYRLAVRILEDNSSASFYGDDYTDNLVIKGQLDLQNIQTGMALAISDLF